MIEKLLILLVALANIATAQRLECWGAPHGYFVPNPRSCAHYFSCVNSWPFEDVCPDGFLFNVRQQICDFKENTDCVSCGTFGIQSIPEPTSCTIFYQCYFGNRLTQTCAPGLHFDTSIGTCNLASVANCDREGNVTVPPITPTVPPVTPTIPPTIPTTLPPPTNLPTEPPIDPPTTPPVLPTPTPPPVTCQPGNIFLPHPSNCANYFLCWNGVPMEFTCPQDLLWNPAFTVRQCDLASRVTCLTPIP